MSDAEPSDPTVSHTGGGSARRKLVALGGLLASIGAIALTLQWVDIDRSVAALQDAESWPWIPLAVASYLIGQFVRGWRCRRLVSPDASLPLLTATNVVVVGYAVNNLLPARLGELARAALLAERASLPFAQSLSVTFVERLVDLVVILFYFAFVASWLELGGWFELAQNNVLVVFALASLAVGILVLWPRRVLWAVARLAPSSVRERAMSLAVAVVQGAAYLRGLPQVVEIVLLSLLVWALEAGMFFFVLLAFGLPPEPLWALVAMSITNLGILFPSSPGFVGTFHFFAMQALVSLGVAASVGLSYAFVVHLTFYLPITVWGLGAVAWYGVRIVEGIAEASSARRSRGVPDEVAGVEVVGAYAADAESVSAGRFMTAVVEALLPAEAADQDACRADVVRFVVEQMAALPIVLKVPLHIGLTGFRMFVRLRTLRGLTSLPADRRRQVTESWAYGRFALTRQLFRPLRSTALLAYYEHPEVIAARPASTEEAA